MRNRLVLVAGVVLMAVSACLAETTKVTFNPFTGKPDFITVLSSATLPSGSTSYVGNVSGSTVAYSWPLGATVNGAANQFLQTNGLGTVLWASPAGGASALGVFQNGVSISSPTSQINFLNPPFIVTLPAATTAQVTLNFSSVTAQGNVFNGASQLVQTQSNGFIPNSVHSGMILSTNTLQTGTSFYTQAGTVNGVFTANGNSVTGGKFVAGSSAIPITTVIGNLDATQLVNLVANSAIDGSSVTKQGNSLNGNSQLVQTTSVGFYPALNGSLITNLTGTNIINSSNTFILSQNTLQAGTTFYVSSGTVQGQLSVGGNIGAGGKVPTQAVDVTGNIQMSAALMPNGQAGVSGSVLQSAGAGNPPTWATLGTLGVNLGVYQSGVQISSPTSQINFLGPPFVVSLAGSTTAQVSLSGSSVTLQGQNVINLQNTLQSGATFYVSSGTVQGSQFNLNAATMTLTGNSPIVLGTNAGVSGQAITSNGPGSLPSWSTTPNLSSTQTWTAGQTFGTSTASTTFNGAIMLGSSAGTIGQIMTSTGSAASPVWATGIKGTTTNDNAPAGNYGEYISSSTAGVPINTPATGVWGDFLQISLTPGDWDVTLLTYWSINATLTTQNEVGISIVSGNSTTGLVFGDNRSRFDNPTTVPEFELSVPVFRYSLAATTTVFGKLTATFTGGQPTAAGRLSARRIR